MLADKMVKLFFLNMGIAMTDIVLFSEGLVGLEIGGASTFQTAIGLTTIVMSGAVFLVGNYTIFNEKKKVIKVSEIKTAEQCLVALKNSNIKKVFMRDFERLTEQTERFVKKKVTINDMLLQKFSVSEMSYSKFNGAISDIESIFYLNVKSILNKSNAFDEADYNQLLVDTKQRNFSEEFIQTKTALFNEYFAFIKEAVEDNEEILLKLDKLLLELSKLSSLELGEIDTMPAMVEIDELISKTKFYK